MTEEREKAIEAQIKWWDFLTKGIRPQTFKQLVYLADFLGNYHYKEAYKELRKRCDQESVPSTYSNYLAMAHSDSIERDYVAKVLGCSDRTARDYLLTLYKLSMKL